MDAGHPHHSWSSRTYRPAGLPPVRVLAAPSSEPHRRRAHTADTQRFWAGHVRLAPDDAVLLVTAPIYVPFQHCDALRTLAVPYGCGSRRSGSTPSLADLDRLPEPTLSPGPLPSGDPLGDPLDARPAPGADRRLTARGGPAHGGSPRTGPVERGQFT